MTGAAYCLLGPTASGKSRLALELAARLPIEIVSVDSAQVYRGMDVGTAKPSKEERRRVPHHLIDLLEPDERYSAGRFRSDAIRIISDILARNRVPLLVGGTMLYYRALVAGLEAMGIAMLVTPEHQANCVNAVCVPEGVDDLKVRARLLDQSNIDIAGGLGKLKGRIWRVGLMGSGSTRENVLLLIDALREAIAAQGIQCPNGREAAETIYDAKSAVSV